MICPLTHDACRTSACAMWVDDHCVLAVLARRLHDASHPQGSQESNPEEMLNECARWVGSPSIQALHRRDVDNYLAHEQIALDFEQRRVLFRMWRNARRASRQERRQEQRGQARPWKIREANHGAVWSDDEDAELTAWFRSGVSIESIAAHHKRSSLAIECRLRKLGLTYPPDLEEGE